MPRVGTETLFLEQYRPNSQSHRIDSKAIHLLKPTEEMLTLCSKQV